jgi:hypothetical protein
MRLCVASSLDEFAQIRFARLERSIGQLSPKQLVPQPNSIGVDDIGLAVICDLLDPAIEKVLLDLSSINAAICR